MINVWRREGRERLGRPRVVFRWRIGFAKAWFQDARGSRRAPLGRALERVLFGAASVSVAVDCRGPGHGIRRVAVDQLLEQRFRLDPQVVRIRSEEPADVHRGRQFGELFGLQRLQEPRRNPRIQGDLVDA